MDPIAYTYDADYHCPSCAIARFGAEPGRSWPRDDATDAEGNPLGAVFGWDDWCLPCQYGVPGSHSIECADCGAVLREHAAAA